jgi:hypothetical protein
MHEHASAKETFNICRDLFDADLASVAAAMNQVTIKMTAGRVWANDELPTSATTADGS